MSLSLEQLQAFVATVETGSFSAAARYLARRNLLLARRCQI
ncbi:LysR family transcriptional regulator [Psychrobacter sp. JCM 18903]|nr:LysR family transcriptional regulator [Psychrobacter sp. JCM 18903]